ELPADGDYTIVANAVRKEAVGAYSLQLESVQRVQVAFREVVQAADQHPRTQVGATVSGRLTPNSALLTDGSSFDAYTFEGQAGQSIEISMESTDFDAFLALGIYGSDSVIARDDDGGNNSDAFIVARLPRTGRYVIIANSYGRDAAGAYTLGVRAGLPLVATNAILAREPGAQRIRIGQTVNGDLRQVTEAMPDASPFQVWYFTGRRGQRVTINMRAADFDTYLHLGIVGTKTMVATDDDGAGGTNSRITATLPEDGTYAVIANSLRPNGRGPYTIELRDGATVDWRAMTNRDVLAVADSFPRLAMGRSVSGALDDRSPVRADDTPFQGYTFDGRRGETVQIDMEAAGFDAYLSVGRAGSDSILGNDDDGGEGTNARLTVTLPQDGRYVVMANAIGKDARGAFTLRMSAGRAASSIAQILSAPPVAARLLRAGTPVQGRLGDADPVLIDRTAYQAWYY
ncbi:MAG TPA: PPC domain-containing protein, partial [Gemmatimonadaceae bacterium]|nr:PPC domain-containing protein [Gemmatimonadaceae bacterium]